MVDVCTREGKGGKEEIIIRRILKNDKRGEAWMKRLQTRRKKREEEQGEKGKEGSKTDGDGR